MKRWRSRVRGGEGGEKEKEALRKRWRGGRGLEKEKGERKRRKS